MPWVVKVIDFGLAKAAVAAAQATSDPAHATFSGTPGFASPEQLSGGEISLDARSDIHSLGATLWYLLCGKAPFPGRSPAEVHDEQLHHPFPFEQLAAAKMPASVIALLRSMLATDPAERPQSARELLEALRRCRAAVESTPRRRRLLKLAALVLALLAISGFGLTSYLSHRQSTPAPWVAPQKSIAVLPLENLSPEKENAFFADGLQDDLLTSLAKVSDLKVISRTSVSQYRGAGAARNLREIGRELGVENVLEGSVRRERDRLLVNVQLIKAREDRHIWAEHYDRALADSVGLQGELARQIAAVLKAKLAPDEKADLSARPTSNPEAYVFYLKAREREGMVNATAEDRSTAEKLYVQAIGLDPTFAAAYARASLLNSSLADGDKLLEAKARKQAEDALRLSPALGEGHLALGLCLYWAEKDYFAALKEFSFAADASPNNPEIFHYIAGIYRRQGRWRESLASDQRALELDPRNRTVAVFAAHNYQLVRDWPAATACYNRALEIAPDSVSARIGLAYLEVFRNSTPRSASEILRKVPAGVDPDGTVTEARWDLAMLARDFDLADKILADFPAEDFPDPNGWPKSFFRGQTARARGDLEAAQRFFMAAGPTIEAWTRDHPEEPNYHETLALLYAYMGRKEEAIREARRALDVEPESQNAFHGASRKANLALVYAVVGEADQAITLIERLLSTPGPVQFPNFPQSITLADLRLRWQWDALRTDPRFQKILAGPEPKTAY